jgi:DNA-binding transcriptional LysR family regulator
MAQSIKSGAVAPLSIALSLSVNIALLIPFLTELVRVFSGLELQFRRGHTSELAELLKKGEVEIAIAGPLGETWDRLDSWSLFTEPYVLALAKDHALSNRKTVRADELVKQRLLCRTFCEHSGEVYGFLKSSGVATDFMHKVVSETDLVALLEARIGIAIAPASSARASGITLLALEGLDVRRTVHAYAVAGRPRSAAGNALIKMLRAADWSKEENAANAA